MSRETGLAAQMKDSARLVAGLCWLSFLVYLVRSEAVRAFLDLGLRLVATMAAILTGQLP